jgi:predicted DNA-binding transcriptional regulator AlpA
VGAVLVTDAPLPTYITAQRVCQLLGISEACLRRYRRLPGAIPFHRMGKSALRYRASEVREWLEEHRVRARSKHDPELDALYADLD